MLRIQTSFGLQAKRHRTSQSTSAAATAVSSHRQAERLGDALAGKDMARAINYPELRQLRQSP